MIDEPGQGIFDLGGALGRTWVLWTERGIAALRPHGALGRRADRDALALAAGVDPGGEAPLPGAIRGPLEAYARGEPVDPASLPVVLDGPRSFVAIWRAARRIGRGEVKSYAEVAAMAGSPRAIRAVGTAMARCSIAIVVPCHRVIAAGMRLGGYGRELGRKRALLRLEGWQLERDRLVRSAHA